jgi:hypothetical protein
VSDIASQAADLARCLARDAEAVCRRYLSNGSRRGRYWVVGDVANAPGRSLFVRLTGPDSGKGAAGKWTDAATGQHGDLLDLIALNLGFEHLRDVLDEARSFLSLPRPQYQPDRCRRQWGHQNPRDGCSQCHSPLPARSRKCICTSAALRHCTTLRHCASILAATIGPMPMHRPKSGRR